MYSIKSASAQDAAADGICAPPPVPDARKARLVRQHDAKQAGEQTP